MVVGQPGNYSDVSIVNYFKSKKIKFIDDRMIENFMVNLRSGEERGLNWETKIFLTCFKLSENLIGSPKIIFSQIIPDQK